MIRFSYSFKTKQKIFFLERIGLTIVFIFRINEDSTQGKKVLFSLFWIPKRSLIIHLTYIKFDQNQTKPNGNWHFTLIWIIWMITLLFPFKGKYFLFFFEKNLDGHRIYLKNKKNPTQGKYFLPCLSRIPKDAWSFIWFP